MRIYEYSHVRQYSRTPLESRIYTAVVVDAVAKTYVRQHQGVGETTGLAKQGRRSYRRLGPQAKGIND